MILLRKFAKEGYTIVFKTIDLTEMGLNNTRLNEWMKQRIQTGLADCDIYDFDSYLGAIIVLGLRRLASTTEIWPPNFATIDEWKNHLYALADHFETAIKSTEWIVSEEDRVRKQRELKKCFSQLGDIYLDLWDSKISDIYDP